MAGFAVGLAFFILVFTFFTIGAESVIGKGSGCKSTDCTFRTGCLAKFSICGAGNAVCVWFCTCVCVVLYIGGNRWGVGESLKARAHEQIIKEFTKKQRKEELVLCFCFQFWGGKYLDLTMANKRAVVFLFGTTQLDNFRIPSLLQHSGIFQQNSRHIRLHLGYL